MRARSRGYWPYLIPGIVLLAIVVVGPFVTNVVTSFTRWSGIGAPIWIGGANYVQLLSDSQFWDSFGHIAAVIVAMAVVPTALGLFLAALLFDFVAPKFSNRVASLFRALFYIPQVLPIAVAGIVWGWILNPTQGALNSLLTKIGLAPLAQNWLGDTSLALPSVMVILLWFQLGYPVVIFMAGLQRVDPSLYEAADLDGANWLQRFTHVIVYQLRPEIYVVILTSTVYALKVFGPIYVLTQGGPADSTNVPSYFAFENFFELSNVGYGSAISTVLSTLVLIFGFVFLTIQGRSENREAK